jgi:hypothetical protein
MAVTITEDLIAGARGRVTQNGKERVRVFYFDGLTSGALAATAPGIWAECEEALRTQKNVDYGLPHPTPADSDLVVIDMQGAPFQDMSKAQAKYIVTYGNPSNAGFAIVPRISFSGTARQVQTSKNADGTIIKVDYTPTGGSAAPPQVARVTAFKNYGILIVERIETIVPALALAAIGCTNADTFQGTEPDTWMIRNVDFIEAGFTVGYKVRYAIEYSEEKDFRPVATFRNVFGQTPDDIDDIDPGVVTGNGWIRAAPSAQFTFGFLGLPVVFT